MNNLKPEHQIITPDVHDRLITKDEWIEVFLVIVIKKSERHTSKKPFGKQVIADVEFHDSPIDISKEELLNIMSHITPNHDSMLRKVNCLMSAPMPNEYIIEVLTEW